MCRPDQTTAMSTRSARLAAVVLAVALLTTGCLGIQERYEAAPATAGDGALSETGYATAAEETLTETRENAGPTDENVTVVSHARSYTRNVSLPGGGGERPLAAFALLSTPSIEVAGSEFNPVADRTAADLAPDLAARAGSRLAAGRIEGLEAVGDRERTVLGTDTAVVELRGVATVEGTEVEMVVELTKVRHDGDFVVAAAVHPAALADEEGSRADRLFGAIEHDTDG